MEPLWNSFWHFCMSWASVTIKMLLQRGKKIKVSLCHDPTLPDRRKHCCSNLEWNVSNVCHTALTWHQLIFTCLAQWKRILLVTDAKLMQRARSWLIVVLFTKIRILCCDTVTDAWTFRVTMGKIKSLFCFLMRIVILNKKLLNSKYSLCIITFWWTYTVTKYYKILITDKFSRKKQGSKVKYVTLEYRTLVLVNHYNHGIFLVGVHRIKHC